MVDKQSTSENWVNSAYAVVIGIGSYKDSKISKLKYPPADAREFANLLVDPNKVGMKKENVKLLLDSEATLTDIKKAIGGWLFQRAFAGSTITIFFAGHGHFEEDRTGLEKDGLTKYLLPWDADKDDLYASALSTGEFERLVAMIKSNRLVIFLDACYSGEFAKGKGSRTIVPTLDNPVIKFEAGSGRVTIAASQPNQRSWEDDSLQHGVFAYHLLEALNGKADYSSDGRMTVTEVFNYLQKEVPRTTMRLAQASQEPRMLGDISADITLAINMEKLQKKQEEEERTLRESKIKEDKDRLFRWYSDGKLTTAQYDLALTVYEANDANLDEKSRQVREKTLELLAGNLRVENYAFTVDKIMGTPEKVAPERIPIEKTLDQQRVNVTLRTETHHPATPLPVPIVSPRTKTDSMERVHEVPSKRSPAWRRVAMLAGVVAALVVVILLIVFKNQRTPPTKPPFVVLAPAVTTPVPLLSPTATAPPIIPPSPTPTATPTIPPKPDIPPTVTLKAPAPLDLTPTPRATPIVTPLPTSTRAPTPTFQEQRQKVVQFLTQFNKVASGMGDTLKAAGTGSQISGNNLPMYKIVIDSSLSQMEGYQLQITALSTPNDIVELAELKSIFERAIFISKSMLKLSYNYKSVYLSGDLWQAQLLYQQAQELTKEIFTLVSQSNTLQEGLHKKYNIFPAEVGYIP